MLKIIFYICLGTLSLGYFSALGKVGNANLYAFDLVILTFSFFGTIYFLSKKLFQIPKYMWRFLIFSFIAIFSISVKIDNLPSNEYVFSLFYLVRWLGYLTASLVVFNMFECGLLSKKEFIFSVGVSAVFISLTGFVQLLILPDFTRLDPSLGWDPHKNRLASTFFDPNFTGAYLVLIFILLVTYVRKPDYRLVMLFAVILGAILLTFSRSTWAMLSVAIMVFGVFKYRWLLLMAVILGFSAYFFVPRVQTRISGTTDPADSAHFRVISWMNTWKIAKDNLAVGVGFNAFRNAQKEYGFLTPDNENSHSASGSDSSLLLVLATTGIFGFLSFLSGFFRFKYLGLIAMSSGILVHSQFVNSLFFPQIMFLWLTGFAYFYATDNVVTGNVFKEV